MPVPSMRLLSAPDPRPRGYRFGPFELEVRSGELKKHGVRLRVRKQSVQILLMLLEQRGEVVLREEIRQSLWPDNTVVEFDHGINTAIQRLRDVLGDSPEEPSWIETLAGRGYRFIQTVQVVERQQDIAGTTAPEADSPSVMTPAGEASRRSPWLQIAVAAGLCAIAGAGWLRTPVSLAPLRNWVLPLGNIGLAVPSPDGSAALYRNSGGLFLRRMDSTAEVQVYAGAQLVDMPVWSPDGTQALFQTQSGLMRMPVPEGPPVMVWPGKRITRGYSWGQGDTILVAAIESQAVGRLYLIPPGGGSPQPLDIPQMKSGRFYQPEFLPEGGKFLFTWAAYGEEEAGIYLATLKHGTLEHEPRLLRRNRTAGQFARGGEDRLFYVQDNNLYAQALDLKSAALRGEPRRIVENAFSSLTTRRAFFAVSRNGTVTWRAGKAATAQLTWFDRSGKIVGKAGPPSELSGVRLSPDERHLLLAIGDQFGGILAANQRAYLRVPDVGIWTQEKERILYTSGGSGRVLERDLPRGSEKEVARISDLVDLWALSPDGKVLLYSTIQGLYSIPLDGPPGQTRPELAAAGYCTHAGFSPDGRWIVYASPDATVNRREVFIKPFAFAGLPQQISTDGGTAPVWRADGQEILFHNDNTIYGVRVRVNHNEIVASAPESLFDVQVTVAGTTGDYTPLAVVRDGSRILFAQAERGSESNMTYIMTDWTRARTP